MPGPEDLNIHLQKTMECCFEALYRLLARFLIGDRPRSVNLVNEPEKCVRRFMTLVRVRVEPSGHVAEDNSGMFSGLSY